MPRITQAQLERQLGGAPILKQLLDYDRDGVADAAAVADVLADAEGEVNSAIGIAVDLNDPNVDTSRALIRHELAVAAHLSYERGTGGLAEPDKCAKEYEGALAWIEKVRARTAGLGIPIRANAAQAMKQITSSPRRPWVSHGSPRRRFGGFS